LKLRFKKLHPDAVLPKYQTQYSSGFDFSALEETAIGPGRTKLVPTGLACALPADTEMQIRPRSGLALKTGYLVKNSPGTVDEDYRGPLNVIVHNLGEETLFIKAGDRFAQGVICPVFRCEIEEVDSLDATDRGQGGFGSTGV